MRPLRCLILGAAGRDFHDFQVFFRARPELRVLAFTAEQIPFIDRRVFPRELAGPGYDADIPIYPERELPELIARLEIDAVFLAYSDLPYAEVMHKASVVQAAGASFALLGLRATQLSSRLPVISVTASRTGAGKSPIAQAIARHLVDHGYAVGVLRHPMPYGDLRRQEVQRFATLADLDRHECTIEEREEYRPYVAQGLTIYAGVDYTKVLAAAEQDVDLILWDGGNNDTSFIRAGLSIVVLDALRPGHETSYYPGETNLRLADVLVINKVAQAEPGAVERVRATITAVHPQAEVIESDLEVVADAADIRGRRALVVEDGPTTTHGGRPWGAGYWAARHCGAAEIIDPRPFAVGTLAAAYREYPHVGPVLPALGYSAAQRDDLAATIRAAAPEVVIDASPARLDSVLALDVPIVTVGYRFAQRAGPDLLQRALEFAAAGGRRGDAAR